MSEKIKFLLLLILVFIFSCQSLFSHAEVVDKILVIVNDEIITQGDLDRLLFPIYEQYKNLYTDQELAEKVDQARRKVLQRLIRDKLLLAEAKRKDIEVTADEVDLKIDEVRKRFPSDAVFKRAMAQENMVVSELEKRFKERMMIDRLIETEISRKISVSPNEILSYYENHKGEFKEPEKIKVRSILIRANDGRSEEATLKLARKILGRLREGASFSLLAEKYSDGPYAEYGGDMGWVKKGELMQKINDLVFSLEENEISGILKTNLGFHIFEVQEKKPARTKEFAEAKRDAERLLFNGKMEKKLNNWIEGLKKNAYIAFR